MRLGRARILGAAFAFAASVFSVSFHLATEIHVSPFSHEHDDQGHEGHRHDPDHAPHPSADHSVEATSAPRPLLQAVEIDLTTFDLGIAAPRAPRFARPADDRAPPERPHEAFSPARAPPL